MSTPIAPTEPTVQTEKYSQITEFNIPSEVQRILKQNNRDPKQLQDSINSKIKAGGEEKAKALESAAALFDNILQGNTYRSLLESNAMDFERSVPVVGEDGNPVKQKKQKDTQEYDDPWYKQFLGNILNGMVNYQQGLIQAPVNAIGSFFGASEGTMALTDAMIRASFDSKKIMLDNPGPVVYWDKKKDELNIENVKDFRAQSAFWGQAVGSLLPSILASYGVTALATAYAGPIAGVTAGAITGIQKKTKTAVKAFTFLGSAAQMYPEYMEEAREAGLSMKHATALAGTIASVNGVIELGATDMIMKRFSYSKETAQKTIREVLNQSAKQTIKSIAGKKLTPDMFMEVLTENAQKAITRAMGGKTVGAVAKQVFQKTGKAAVEALPEAGEEFGQEWTWYAGRELYNKYAQEYQNKTGKVFNTNVKESLTNSIVGAIAGQTLGTGIALRKAGPRVYDQTAYAMVLADVRNQAETGIDDVETMKANGRLFQMIEQWKSEGQFNERPGDPSSFNQAEYDQVVANADLMYKTAFEFRNYEGFTEADSNAMFTVAQIKNNMASKLNQIQSIKDHISILEEQIRTAPDPATEIKLTIEKNKLEKDLGGFDASTGLYELEWQTQQGQQEANTLIGNFVSAFVEEGNRQYARAFLESGISAIDDKWDTKNPTEFKTQYIFNLPSGQTIAYGGTGMGFRYVTETSIPSVSVLDQLGKSKYTPPTRYEQTYEPIMDFEEFMQVTSIKREAAPRSMRYGTDLLIDATEVLDYAKNRVRSGMINPDEHTEAFDLYNKIATHIGADEFGLRPLSQDEFLSEIGLTTTPSVAPGPAPAAPAGGLGPATTGTTTGTTTGATPGTTTTAGTTGTTTGATPGTTTTARQKLVRNYIGQTVSYNGQTGTLIQEGNTISVDTGNRIYEIPGANLDSDLADIGVSAGQISTGYDVRDIDGDSVAVNGQRYTMNYDKNGNVESLSPENNPDQKLTNNAMLIAVDIERSKQDHKAFSQLSEEEIDEVYQEATSTVDGKMIAENIFNLNFSENVETGIDKLYNGEELSDAELNAVDLWAEDALVRVQKIRATGNDSQELQNLEDFLTKVTELSYDETAKREQRQAQIEASQATSNDGDSTTTTSEESQSEQTVENGEDTNTQGENVDTEVTPDLQSEYAQEGELNSAATGLAESTLAVRNTVEQIENGSETSTEIGEGTGSVEEFIEQTNRINDEVGRTDQQREEQITQISNENEQSTRNNGAGKRRTENAGSNVKPTVVKTIEKDGYTYNLYNNGDEEIINPKGEKINKYTKQQPGKKRKVSANFSKTKARILGELTENQINQQRRKLEKEAIGFASQYLAPTEESAYTQALVYFANGGKVNPRSIEEEISGKTARARRTGKGNRGLNEYRWAWFGSSSKEKLPSIFGLAENIYSYVIGNRDNDANFDANDVRNLIIDIISSYSGVPDIRQSLVSFYEQATRDYTYGMDTDQAVDYMSNQLSEQEINDISQGPGIDQDGHQDYWDSYFDEKYNNVSDEELADLFANDPVFEAIQNIDSYWDQQYESDETTQEDINQLFSEENNPVNQTQYGQQNTENQTGETEISSTVESLSASESQVSNQEAEQRTTGQTTTSPRTDRGGSRVSATRQQVTELLQRIAKAFPNIKVHIPGSAQEYRDHLDMTPGGRELTRKGDSEPYGFIDPLTGYVYLNPEKLNLNTPIHEFGHVWVVWARANNNELYARGRELAVNSPYFKTVQSDPRFSGLTHDQMIEEAMAMAIGDKGERFLVSSRKNSVRQWISDIFDAVKKFFGFDSKVANLEDMTFDDFAQMAAEQILSGKEVSDISSEQLSELFDEFDDPIEVGDNTSSASPRVRTMLPPAAPLGTAPGETVKTQAQYKTDAETVLGPIALKSAANLTNQDKDLIKLVASETGWEYKGDGKWEDVINKANVHILFTGDGKRVYMPYSNNISSDLGRINAGIHEGIGRILANNDTVGGKIKNFIFKNLISYSFNLDSFISIIDNKDGLFRKLLTEVKNNGRQLRSQARQAIMGTKDEWVKAMAAYSPKGSNPDTIKKMEVEVYYWDTPSNRAVKKTVFIPIGMGMNLVRTHQSQMSMRPEYLTKRGESHSTFVIDDSRVDTMGNLLNDTDETPFQGDSSGKTIRTGARFLGDVWEKDPATGRLVKIKDSAGNEIQEFSALLSNAEMEKHIQRFETGLGAESIREVEAYRLGTKFYNNEQVTELLRHENDEFLNPDRPFQKVDFYAPVRAIKTVDASQVTNLFNPSLEESRMLHYREVRPDGAYISDDLAAADYYQKGFENVLLNGRLVHNLKKIYDAVNSENYKNGPIKNELKEYLKNSIDSFQNLEQRKAGEMQTMLARVMEYAMRKTTSYVFRFNFSIGTVQLATYASAYGQGHIKNKYLNQALGNLGKLATGAYFDTLTGGGSNIYDTGGGNETGRKNKLGLNTVERKEIEWLMGDHLTDPTERAEHRKTMSTLIDRMIYQNNKYVEGIDINDPSYLTKAIGGTAGQLLNKWDDFQENHGMSVIRRADRAVLLSFLRAAKMQVADEVAAGTVSPDEATKRIADLTAGVMYATNQMGEITEQTPLQRSSNVLVRAISLYTGQTQKLFNQMAQNMIEYIKWGNVVSPTKKIELRNRLARSIVSTMIVNTAAVVITRSLFGAIRRGLRGEEEKDWEYYKHKMAFDTLRLWFGIVPGIAEQVMSVIISNVDNESWTETLFEVPGLESIEQTINMTGGIFKYLTAKDNFAKQKYKDNLLRTAHKMLFLYTGTGKMFEDISAGFMLDPKKSNKKTRRLEDGNIEEVLELDSDVFEDIIEDDLL